MIRKFKILFGALLALVSIGAIDASGGQAAEFHCNVEPCRLRLNPDGEGKTAHQVFIIDDVTTGLSLSFTCARLTGEGTTSTKTSSEVLITNLSYNDVPCTVAGSTGVTINMMECGYKLTAAGNGFVVCPSGQRIRFEKPNCTYEVGEQGPLSGITYTTLGSTPNREVTVSMNVKGIALSMTGTTAGCLVNPADKFEATLTTGNTIVTAETDPGEVMADGWWL
jgi:hypothetical protein